MSLITRMVCPGPFQDAVATTYRRVVTMPRGLATIYWMKKYGITGAEAAAIAKWCSGEGAPVVGRVTSG